jgi:hypothetical protein
MSEARGSQADADGGPPRPRRGMLGFYLAALGLLLALAGLCVGWPRIRAWHRERTVTQDFINSLDKRVSVELTESPQDALQWVQGLMTCGVIGDYRKISPPSGKLTLKCENAPLAVLLDSWCAQVGADWTVASDSTSFDGRPKFALFIADPARIRELEAGSPTAARMIRRYRERLAREHGGAGRGAK